MSQIYTLQQEVSDNLNVCMLNLLPEVSTLQNSVKVEI